MIAIAIVTFLLFLKVIDPGFYGEVMSACRHAQKNALDMDAALEAVSDFMQGQITLGEEIGTDEQPDPDGDTSTTGEESSPTSTTPPMGGGDDDFTDVEESPLDADSIQALCVHEFCLPTQGPLSSGYGMREDPFSGEMVMHGGIDLDVPTGTQVVAVMDGKVVRAGESEDFGNIIVLQHGDSLRTYYAHCHELLAEQGAQVNKGDVIARSGSTGKSTGPHLHFEIRINNKRINPLWLLDGVD